MDNASKALIMAGAILISIAIVGVGVYIFSTTSSVSDSVGSSMDAYTANQLNSQLRVYEGTKVKGSTINEFLALVATFNANATFPVDITNNGGLTSVSKNALYKLTLSDDDKDGYLEHYKIETYSATPTT